MSGRGVRARVREHRLGLLHEVLDAAEGPLTNDEIVERLRALDGVGIPRRTLLMDPFQPLVAAQAKRRGSLGELSGTAWRLRRLTDEGRWSLAIRLERRLETMDRLDADACRVGDGDRAAPASATGPRRSARSGTEGPGGEPVTYPERLTGMTTRQCIDHVAALEAEVDRRAAAFKAGVAARLKRRFVERRTAVRDRREAELMAAYRELRPTSPSGPPC